MIGRRFIGAARCACQGVGDRRVSKWQPAGAASDDQRVLADWLYLSSGKVEQEPAEVLESGPINLLEGRFTQARSRARPCV